MQIQIALSFALLLLPGALCSDWKNTLTSPPEEYKDFWQHEPWHHVSRSSLGIMDEGQQIDGGDIVANLACSIASGGAAPFMRFSACYGDSVLVVCDNLKSFNPIYVQIGDCKGCRNNYHELGDAQVATCQHIP